MSKEKEEVTHEDLHVQIGELRAKVDENSDDICEIKDTTKVIADGIQFLIVLKRIVVWTGGIAGAIAAIVHVDPTEVMEWVKKVFK